MKAYNLILSRSGLYFLYLGALVPMFNAIRIFIIMPTLPSSDSLYFFAKVGPFNLFLAGMCCLINIYFFLLKQKSGFWYAHLFGVLWVGGSDAIGGILNYLSTPQTILPILLPVFVTLINLTGLACIKNFVFGAQADPDKI